MSIKANLQKNLQQQPHSVVTVILLALGIILIGLALVPDHWLLKVLAIVWVILP